MSEVYEISPDLLSAFQNANQCFQNGKNTVRILKVSAEGNMLNISQTVESRSNAEEDFNLLTEIVTDYEAAVLLYCISDLQKVIYNKEDNLQWLTITWIPENCNIRDKMFISSSARHLTLQKWAYKNIVSEYAANKIGELTWSQYRRYTLYTIYTTCTIHYTHYTLYTIHYTLYTIHYTVANPNSKGFLSLN